MPDALVLAKAGYDLATGAKVFINVKDFGAIGDGNSHPLSQKYSTLASAQLVYPHAKSFNNNNDKKMRSLKQRPLPNSKMESAKLWNSKSCNLLTH